MNSIQEESNAVATIPESDLPYISVVVIGRNEGERLTRCLESVRAADYPHDKLELIYVDSDSRDDSCATAQTLGAKVVPIKPKYPSAASGRNAGLSVASHDLVQFLDGDTILDGAWFKTATGKLGDLSVACVFGRREELRPDASLYMRVASLDWYVPEGPAKFCGGDALFRRSVLEEVGHYEEWLVAGEEPELCFRIRSAGFTIWRCDAPMTGHDLAMLQFGQYWQRAVRSGWAYLVVAATCRRPSERLWFRENVSNLVELLLWVIVLVLGSMFWKWWSLAVLGVLITARSLWIAARVHARAKTWTLAILYGLNCQFMRIPLFVGQLRGLWYLLFRRPARLIEYKK